MQAIPIVTVTCFRDLDLLELQAQSISLYLDKKTPVYIIVNEDDTSPWFSVFDQTIRHYYKNHELTILPKRYFRCAWEQWIPSSVNPWAVGWETQQILKLAMSIHIRESGYLVLDSQNFLINDWVSDYYSIIDNRVPYRTGIDSMPDEIWTAYANQFNIQLNLIDRNKFSNTTPIFLHSEVCRSLIADKGGITEFSIWFKTSSRIKSEFILYRMYLESLGGIDQFHYEFEDSWASPYLRDSRDRFLEGFNNFVTRLGDHFPHKWASINHRSWGDMTEQQYQLMQSILKKYNLNADFNEYRSKYIDYKF